jgi:predicted esterase
MLESRWTIFTAPDPKSCILALPGRSQHGSEVGSYWLHSELEDSLIVCVTPENREWYPMPLSPQFQEEAVAGLENSRLTIESVIVKIMDEWHIDRNKIAIVGFSAGGVMALYTAMHASSPLAGVVSHGGAILEPNKVPECKFPEMPIVLTHCKDDGVFKWDERYLPMANALEENNYDLYRYECNYGGHGMDVSDVQFGAYHLARRLGYPKSWNKQREGWT